MNRFFVSLLFFAPMQQALQAQESSGTPIFENQVSTNLILPIFESVDLGYERTIANKWAIGLAGAIYGDRISELDTDSYENKYDTDYELMPFVRIYFQGAQNKSHFLELFGSLSQVKELREFIRTTNSEGYGVYTRGVRKYTAGGLGIGYGYRFLPFDRKLVLEVEFGIRTNFTTDFITPYGAFVRTGIKVGYRF